ncbi:MAG: 4-hydroxy-tetrahydrodipicolinate reductase, partial [Verrucomicrobiae bacterium]|nr:4-hydroxy-tetrahydrodipicolinate reductase [Verrucomicrobiae bacterium]
MTKVIITGSKGRMGQTLIACAKKLNGIEVVAQIDKDGDLAAVVDQGEVVIDFSSHSATVDVARICAAHNKALVIGTTGHTDTDTFDIQAHKKTIPIVWASNFS